MINIPRGLPPTTSFKVNPEWVSADPELRCSSAISWHKACPQAMIKAEREAL
jgi:hypothetical protein